MVPSLPVEIYARIVCHIHEITDLLNLLITSKTLASEAERLLYHTLSIDEEHDHRRMHKFLRCISSTPRIARLIQQLDIRIFYNDRLEMLRSALLQLHNLYDLRLRIPLILSGDPADLLQDMPFRLTSFASNLIFSEGLDAFLTSQPLITQLEFIQPLHNVKDRLTRPTAPLPSLTTLIVNRRNGQAPLSLLEGRPVTRLSIVGSVLTDSPLSPSTTMRAIRMGRLALHDRLPFPNLLFIDAGAMNVRRFYHLPCPTRTNYCILRPRHYCLLSRTSLSSSRLKQDYCPALDPSRSCRHCCFKGVETCN